MEIKMELPSLVLLILIALSSIYIIACFNRRPPARQAKSTSPAVLHRGYPLVGNLPHFIKNMYRMLEWSTELISSSPSGTVVLPPFIFTSNPDVVEHTSKSRFPNYIKAEEITAAIHDFLGRGILNVDGDEWRLQRKSASYEFKARSLRTSVLDKVRHEIDARLVPLLAEAGRAGRVLDLQDLLERFAFDNICSIVLGTDPDCLRESGGDGERFFGAFGDATKIVVERGMKNVTSVWRLKRLLNVGSERRLKESMAVVREFVDKSVASAGRTFLSRLAGDESYSDESVRDILISFVLAGRDTTPSALTWFFWSLSTSPDVTRKIVSELRAIRSRRGQGDEGAFTADELREMNYLHAAISESLRLHPPVPLVPRKCVEDDVLPDGTAVRRGWMVMYNAYAMARREGIWGRDCEEFRPERWLEAESGTFRPRSPFEYPVFHAGPRVCLGKEMAYVQMKAVAASVLERFEVEVAEERGKPRLGMTMMMDGGLPVKIKERADCAAPKVVYVNQKDSNDMYPNA